MKTFSLIFSPQNDKNLEILSLNLKIGKMYSEVSAKFCLSCYFAKPALHNSLCTVCCNIIVKEAFS